MAREDRAMPSSVADLAALAKLFEEHRRQLLTMVERRLDPALAPRIDAEDILSEAYLEAQRKWTRFKEQAKTAPYAWLYGIVRDRLIEAWRRQTREPRNPERELPWPERSSVQLGLGLVNPGTTPSEALARNELQQRMRQALECLKEPDRELLWMRHYDQLSFGDAALVLGITENAATVRYVRALRRLKELWQQLHPEKEFE